MLSSNEKKCDHERASEEAGSCIGATGGAMAWKMTKTVSDARTVAIVVMVLLYT